MKNLIIVKKTGRKKILLAIIADIIASAEVTWASSFINLFSRYKGAIRNIYIYIAKKPELTRIKKY